VLKRGRMRMAPPPSAIQKAEQDVITDSAGKSTLSKTYRLIPSKTSVQDFQLTLDASDIPLFVADRLAFASNKGPQLPLLFGKGGLCDQL